MIPHGGRVLCAVSGGVDSVVLLHIMLEIRNALGIEVCAAHLNHMLRGEDSDGDEEFVRSLCGRYGVPFISERADVKKYAESSGESIELAARNVRYDFLRRAAEKFGAQKIATAHNANDSLETMLINIARGSGSNGLCGIPPERNGIIRPLIYITRAEIEKYAESRGISYREDKTNREAVYSRNNLRLNAVPALLYVNPSAVENASRAAKLLRAETRLLEEFAERELTRLERGAKGKVKCDELLALDCALFGRVVRLLASQASGDEEYTLEFKHAADVEKLAKSPSPSGVINLPGGITARREYEFIIFEKECERKLPEEKRLSEGETRFGEYIIRVKKTEKCGKIHNSVNTFCISCDRIQDSLIVRSRRPGDCIRLPGRPQKSIKKLFTDEKVPRRERDFIPVICDGENVAAVAGFGADERYADASGEAFFIEIKNI